MVTANIGYYPRFSAIVYSVSCVNFPKGNSLSFFAGVIETCCSLLRVSPPYI
jgi:hypothetical protein